MTAEGQCPKCGKLLIQSWDFDEDGKQVPATLCIGYGGSCDYKETRPMSRLWCWLFHRKHHKVYIGPFEPWCHCGKCGHEWEKVW